MIAMAVVIYQLLPQDKRNVTTIDLSEKITETEIAKELPKDSVKIAVSAMVSPKETINIYKDILDYIGKKIGKDVEMVQRKTYDEVNELVKKQEVLAAFVCSGPYVNGHDDFGMEIVVAPQMYGEAVYYSYIIVAEDSPIKNFNELKGKDFAFTDQKSNTGKIVPTYILAKIGETPDSFFKKYIFTGSHDNSIEAVAKKMVDGAAVDHLIYEYLKVAKPEFVAGTKVIEKHGPYGMPPLVVHPEVNKGAKEQLKGILLDMDKDPVGKELLNKIKIEKFVESADENYASVREMESWIKTVGTKQNENK